MRFDFMLSNPPYGKSWKSDQAISRMARRCSIRASRCSCPILRAGGRCGCHAPLFRRPAALPDGDGEQDEAAPGQPLARASPRCTTARRSLPAMPAAARAISAATSSRTTGSKRSSSCPTTSSTTPASPPISGCSPTTKRRSGAARCS